MVHAPQDLRSLAFNVLTATNVNLKFLDRLSRPRRDFLLDSGGVSALAASRGLLVAYINLLVGLTRRTNIAVDVPG